MIVLTNEELNSVTGGAISATSMINSVAKMISTLIDLGRMIGSAIRYASNKKYRC